MLALAEALAESPGWAPRFVAYELVAAHQGAFSKLTPRLIDRLSRGLADWGMVDAFGCTLSGAAWREGLISSRKVAVWARSEDRWRRRLALVSTVPLNVAARGGTGDPSRTLAVCSMLVDDRDDMVVKALSWALRALARPEPGAVRKFMKENGDRLAPLVRREVKNVLERGRKY